jgi:hypothetical protein
MSPRRHRGARAARRVAARAEREAGQVGGIEVLPLAVLVFVVGTLLVANAWAVVDAKAAAGTAAREAARAYAETPAGMPADAAWARAEASALAAYAAAGKDPTAATVAPAEGAGSVARCTRIVVETSYRVPALTVPWVGGLGDGLVVRARHAARVDPFRSGLDGDGCG